MKLNENEINYIFSECLLQILEEESKLDKLRNNSTYNYDRSNIQYAAGYNFDDNDVQSYQLDNRHVNKQNYRKGKIGRYLKPTMKAVGTVVGTGLAGMTALSILSALGAEGIGGIISSLSFYGGLGIALKQAAESHRRYSLLKNMKIPRSVNMAKQVASLAAAERITLQEECRILQANFNNALSAYNGLYGQYANYKLSWDIIKKHLKTDFSLLTQLGGDTVETNIDTNFNDKNVTEGKLYENTFSNEEYGTKVIPENNFIKYFQDKDDSAENFEFAVETVYGIAQLYIDTYQLWYQWSRYIKVLIDYFPEDLKWQEILKTAGKYQPESIWKSIYHKLLPNLSQVTDAIGDRINPKNKEGKTRDEIAKEIKKKYNTSSVVKELKVYSTQYNRNGIIFTVFDVINNDNDNDEKYAIATELLDNANLKYNRGEIIQVKNIDSCVFKTVEDENFGFTIKLLNKNFTKQIVK